MVGRVQQRPSALRVRGSITPQIRTSACLNLSTYLWYGKWELDTLPLLELSSRIETTKTCEFMQANLHALSNLLIYGTVQ